MITNLAKYFITAMDTDNNGTVNLSEYQAYLKTVRMPANMANTAISLFDSNGDNAISETEMFDGYTANDANANGSIDYNEYLNIQNQLSGVIIDTSTTSAQYNSLFSSASGFIASSDINSDGQVTVEEYAALLKTNNYDPNGAAALINYYDTNGDNQVSLLEFQQHAILMDADDNGSLSATELAPAVGLLRKLSPLELFAKNLVSRYDGATGEKDVNNVVIKDGVLSYDEYVKYLNAYGLPLYLADNLYKTYGSGSTISYDQLVGAFKAFDADGDGSLAFEESITYQNSLSHVQFDPAMNQTQYSNLFNIASKFIKAVDANKDGNADVTEVRAYVETSNSKITDSKLRIPDGYAENMLLMFDRDNNATPGPGSDPLLIKDGAVDMFEYMKGLMTFDKTGDGKLDAAETLTLKDQLYNTKLFDNVNEIFTEGDSSGDKTVDAGELGAYYVSQGLPSYLANDIIKYIDTTINTPYDLDGDGKLSRLEFMQIYKSFDANSSNTLDADENLNLLDTLTSKTVNLTLDAGNIKQYTNMVSDLQEYVKDNDLNNDGTINADELKAYYAEQNLSKYFADNAIKQFDVTGSTTGTPDGSLDLVELFKMNNQADTNSDGIIQLNEELALDEVLSGVVLNATPANEVQYGKLYDNLSDYLTKNDINSDKELDLTELKAYFNAQGLPDYLATSLINTYDFNKSGNVDLLEFMNANIEFDADKSGSLSLNENLALESKISGVNLGAMAANEAQFASLVKDAQTNSITKFDVNLDKMLDSGELKAYFKSVNMPEELVASFLGTYDVSGAVGGGADGNIDLLEFMKSSVDYDVDKSGVLELNEQLTKEGDLAGINLGANSGNINQFSSYYEIIKDIIANFDGTGDKQLSSFELQEYFKLKNLSTDLAAGLLTQYDNDFGASNGKIDMLEWMKAYVDYDVNKNGKLEFNEQIAFSSFLDGVKGLSPTPANENQYKYLFDSINYDISKHNLDGDNKLNYNAATNTGELADYFNDKNIPSYLAKNFIAKYDANGDGQIDSLELLKANVDYDTNLNGNLEFNESLALNSDTAGLALNSNTTNEKQYQALYNNNTISSVTKFDSTKDKMLNQAELGALYVSEGFSASLAVEALNIYDANKDGSLDYLELLKSNIDYDDSESGVIGLIETNEILAQYSKFALVNGVSSDSAYASENIGNFNTAKAAINLYDNTGNKNLDETEMREYFKSYLGIPNYMADAFIAKYDTNADLELNNLEMMKGFIDADANGNGLLEFDDVVNMYAGLSTGVGATVTVDAANNNQIQSLWTEAYSNTILKYDASGNKELERDEVIEYFKSSLGLPEYAADNFIAQYANANGKIDSMGLLKAFTDMDNAGAIKNGAVDFGDWINLFASTTANATGSEVTVDAANNNQIQSLWTEAYNNTILKYDASGNKELERDEVIEYFKGYLGLPAYAADNFIAQYANANGKIDSMGLLKAFTDMDNAGAIKNGAVDFGDWINLYASTTNNATGADVTVDATNNNQIKSLWTEAYTNSILKYDASGNKELERDEVIQYFNGYLGLPAYAADNFIAQYANANGKIDSMGLLKAFTDMDNAGVSKNGAMDFEDWIALYDDATGINVNINDDNRVQIKNFWNMAYSAVIANDGNGNKLLSSSELGNYFKTIGMTQEMADNFLASHANYNGSIDAMGLFNTLRSFDTDESTALESGEWMSLLQSVSGVSVTAGYSNPSFASGLFSSAAGMLKFDNNKDAQADTYEFTTYLAASGYTSIQIQNIIAMSDLDGDSYIDLAEWLKTIENFDTNKDGVIDAAESASIIAAIS